MRAKVLVPFLPVVALLAAGCSGSSGPAAGNSERADATTAPVADADRSTAEPTATDAEPAKTAVAPDVSPTIPRIEATPGVLFRAEDGSFVALFPGKPETSTETLQEGGALTVFRSADGGMERQVSAFDLPEPIGREEAEATLLTVATSIVEAAGGEAIETAAVAGRDYPAVRYDYVYQAGEERFRTSGLLAVVDRRQFQASVLAGAESWDAEAAAEFLDSFRPTYRTPTLTAPQVSDSSADGAPPSATQLLPPASAGADPPATTVSASRTVEEEEGVRRELPWVEATVRFPAEPEAVSDESTAESHRLFHAFAGSQSFTVTLHREEEPLPVEISREILASTAEAIATSAGGEEIVSEPIADERFADHRLSYRYADEGSGAVRVRQRLLFVDAVQIYLIVAGPADDFDEAAADRFLDSFELIAGDAVAESETIDAAAR